MRRKLESRAIAEGVNVVKTKEEIGLEPAPSLIGNTCIGHNNTEIVSMENPTAGCVSQDNGHQDMLDDTYTGALAILNKLGEADAITSELAEQAAGCVTGLLARIKDFDATSRTITASRYLLVGRVLKQVERLSPSKSAYMRWVRDHFNNTIGLEALRQGRRLADLGTKADELLLLGKNRMLELYYVLTQMSDVERQADGTLKSEKLWALLDKYVLAQDSGLDSSDARLLRIDMDTVITIYRLDKVGVPNTVCTFELAKMVALFRGKAIEVEMAKKVRKILPDNAAKMAPAFRDWVKNRMVPVSDDDKEHDPPSRRLELLAQWIKEQSVKYGSNAMLFAELSADENAIKALRQAQIELAQLTSRLPMVNENKNKDNNPKVGV